MCPRAARSTWTAGRSAAPDEPVPIAHVRTLEDVYRFEPVPPQLTPEEAAHVIGTQANIWTEMMDSVRVLDYRPSRGWPPSPRSPGPRCPPRPTATAPDFEAG